jgi:hypothetical protein
VALSPCVCLSRPDFERWCRPGFPAAAFVA